MDSILWGLFGAMLIGGSDCIARVTSQRVPLSVLFLMIMGVSLMVLTIGLGTTGNWPPWHTKAWVASALSGFLNLLALYFLYKALARGPVAVASPAASVFTVLLVGMNIFAGEIWSWWQLLAILLVFIGIGLLARPTAVDADTQQYDARWLRKTAALGLATAVTVALRMFLAQEAGADLGAMHALYLNRAFALTGAILLVCYYLLSQNTLVWPRGKIRILVGVQAVFETAALGAFLVGSANGGRIGATIGFSAFAAATAIFAWIWLGERIGWQRGLCIGTITLGVVLAVVSQPG